MGRAGELHHHLALALLDAPAHHIGAGDAGVDPGFRRMRAGAGGKVGEARADQNTFACGEIAAFADHAAG